MANLNKNILDSNSQGLDEVIRSLMRREGDILERNFLRYRDVARDVFRDLNLTSIKYTERRLIEVDPKTRRVQLPCNTLKLSSIGIIDDNGKIQTLIIDTNLKDDIVDISLKKDCGCECGCKGGLCGQIKNYEAILEDVTEDLPGGGTQVFTTIVRKLVYPDGTMYVSKTYPIRKYESGEWVSTELTTDEEYLCKLEVNKCGCIKECDHNHNILGTCINADDIETECGSSVCSCVPGGLTYNYTELGNVLQLSSDFSYDKVLVRVFVELGVKEIQVPLLARRIFMYGLKAYALEMDDRVPQAVKENYVRKFNQGIDSLAITLHKCSLAETYAVLTPKRIFP